MTPDLPPKQQRNVDRAHLRAIPGAHGDAGDAEIVRATVALGQDFVRSEEIEEVAGRLIEKHAFRLGAIHSIRVLYLLNGKPFDEEKEERSHDAIGKAIKAPVLWRDVSGYDAVIWVRGYFWGKFDARQREAIVLHELLHLDVDAEGALRIAKHEIEEFGLVVREYGRWLEDIDLFARQLSLFEEPGA